MVEIIHINIFKYFAISKKIYSIKKLNTKVLTAKIATKKFYRESKQNKVASSSQR